MTLFSRRYLTFSLRTLFVLTTALAVWLGVVVNRAREQREAVKAIEQCGGHVTYDWQFHDLKNWPHLPVLRPPGPAWLRRLIGDDFFQNVVEIEYSPHFPPEGSQDIDLIPHFQKLRRLKKVIAVPSNSQDLKNQLEAALPNCVVGIIPQT